MDILDAAFTTVFAMPAGGTISMFDLIPKPVELTPANGAFILTSSTKIVVDENSPELVAIGRYLAELFKVPTGFNLQVDSDIPHTSHNIIILTIGEPRPALRGEGYTLTISPDQIKVTANVPAGVFWAVQTIRQLFSPSIEETSVQPGPWSVPALSIRDCPRFPWRGAMLDLGRHFFGVEDVKHYIDLMAYYKLNRLHLHLTDDQGWRIMINSWPNLAKHGGKTAVNGDPGGYYTQEEYSDIVAYAQSRYIMVIPEFDMPGHTNAALASYPELNADGVAPDLYTGIEVGFSSFCIPKGDTYEFIDDVISEIAALTPGPYIHIGGDEAHATSEEDYKFFIERVQEIVKSHGKQTIGWAEIGRVDLLPTTIAQYWNIEPKASDSILQGLLSQPQRHVIMSPATKSYLDMKYDPSCPLGLHWAGYVEVQDAYEWDPAAVFPSLCEDDILGIEAPLWSETLVTMKDIEFMAFPRLPGLAEIGWSPAEGRTWEEYRQRLAVHALRLDAMGVNYYRSPQVEWQQSDR
jgi:hexosaminidase